MNDNELFKENLKQLSKNNATNEVKNNLKHIGKNAKIVLNTIKNNREDER